MLQPYSENVYQHVIQPWDRVELLAKRFHTSVDSILKANPGIQWYGLYVGQLLNIPTVGGTKHCIIRAEHELKNNWRLIWEQHVNWTRMAIISLTFKLPDVNFVLTRLLQNATDMGNLLKPYYGEQLARQFSSLIKEHLVIAADLVKAAIAGNSVEVADIEKK
ncbi:MAG: LysM domain-containing protein [Paenisporosarcina sp.]